jgi:bacterioferritin
MPQFVKDVEEIRQRAIRKLEDGAVTQAYGVDKDHAIDILNEALATEIVCVLRYMHHYFMATGIHGKGVADEFKEHADAEREHADMIAERIQQLGGKPDFNPKTLMERSASQYIEGETLADMIREDLIAERVVIEVYTEMIRYFGDKDPTTRHIIEEILQDEEEHASDLSDLLYVVDPKTGEEKGQDPGTDPLTIEHRQRGSQKQSAGKNGGQAREEKEEEQPIANNKGKQRGGDESRQQGMSNRDAQQELAGGGLKGQERGMKSLNTSSRQSAQKGRGNEVEPAHIPGTTGRPKRQRTTEFADVEPGNVHEGEAAGTNRAVRVTNANRKRKKVA